VANRRAVLVEPAGSAHLAGLSGLVDPNDAPEAADLVELAPPGALEADRALALPDALEDKRLVLQDEARQGVPEGARQDVLDAHQGVPEDSHQDAQGGVGDDARGVWADVAEDVRSPHQQSVPVDALDALQEACEIAGTPAHGLLVVREAVVELYQTQEEEVSISWRPAEMAAPVLLQQ
jgi:hypothetical protein